MLLQGDLQGKVFAATSANPVVNLLLQGVEDVKEVEVLLVEIRLKAMAFGPEAV